MIGLLANPHWMVGSVNAPVARPPRGYCQRISPSMSSSASPAVGNTNRDGLSISRGRRAGLRGLEVPPRLGNRTPDFRAPELLAGALVVGEHAPAVLDRFVDLAPAAGPGPSRSSARLPRPGRWSRRRGRPTRSGSSSPDPAAPPARGCSHRSRHPSSWAYPPHRRCRPSWRRGSSAS